LAAAEFDRRKSRRLLAELRLLHPQHPATRLSSEVLAKLETKSPGPSVIADVDLGPFAPEPKSALARGELVSFQTFAGIGFGLELCIALECEDGRAVAALLGLSGGAALTASLLTTRNGVTHGQALLVNSATSWGIWNGLALAGIADVDDSTAVGGLMAGGHLIGVGTGIAMAKLLDPNSGDVSLANSTGIWSGVLVFFINAGVDFDTGRTGTFGSVLLASDLGLLGGAILATTDTFRMSRARALVIDSGGIVGGLFGMGFNILIEGEVRDEGRFFGLAILGTLTGLTVTTLLTQGWDAPDVPAQVAFSPVKGGGVFSIGGQF